MNRTSMFLLILAACAKQAPTQQPQSLPASECMTPDRAVVVVMTNPEGYLEPCGCTSNPLGGIARLSAYWQEQKRCQKDPVLVSVGNFLYDNGKLDGPNREQEQNKAQLIHQIYLQMGVLAQTPGPFDKPHVATTPAPWLRHGEVRMAQTAGVQIAFVGVEDSADAITLPKADVLIALSSRGWTQNRELKGFDVIVSSGSPEPRQPAIVGHTVIVEAGTQGQYAGVLELVKGEPAEYWRFFDGGIGDLALLKRQLTAFKKESNAIYAERAAAVSKEIAELEAHPPAPPTQKHIRFSLLPLTKKMPEDPDTKKRVAGYNAKLCDFSKRATENLVCPPAPTGSATYVGSETCGTCHQAALKQWQTQKHAHAVKTLEDAGKLCDLGCIGCHTTGYGKAGGFCSPQKIGALKDVGCENCHGAGSLHVQAPPTHIERNPSISVCMNCHTKEHSDTFDFATYRARIVGPGHGQPIAVER